MGEENTQRICAEIIFVLLMASFSDFFSPVQANIINSLIKRTYCSLLKEPFKEDSNITPAKGSGGVIDMNS